MQKNLKIIVKKTTYARIKNILNTYDKYEIKIKIKFERMEGMLEKTESITAKICAFSRAYHSYFEINKVYDDYLAFDLLGYEEYEKTRDLLKKIILDDPKSISNDEWKKQLNHNILPIPISRIKYAEDKLLSFAEKNNECQYVICGSGFDTFAFRNSNDNIKIFELDHPNTQKYKINRVKEINWVIPKNLNFVPIDFNKESIEERLLSANFNPKIKTFFAILGVSYYLDLDTLSKTFESISKLSASGSQVVLDYPDNTNWHVERVNNLREVTASLGEEMGDGYDFHQIQEKLAQNGYKIIDYKDPKDIQKSYFNNRNDNLSAYENVHYILAQYK